MRAPVRLIEPVRFGVSMVTRPDAASACARFATAACVAGAPGMLAWGWAGVAAPGVPAGWAAFCSAAARSCSMRAVSRSVSIFGFM